MGCEESRTIDDSEEYHRRKKNSDEIDLLNQYEGWFESAEGFVDTVIVSEEELGEKVRTFIATQVPSQDNPNHMEYNINDDILTKSYSVNFEENVIIVVNGISISRIEKKSGNYWLYHSGNAVSSKKYYAYVVEKISSRPSLHFVPAKPTLLD